MKASFSPFCSPLHFCRGTASVFYASHVTPVHAHNTLQLVFDITGSFRFRTIGTGWESFKSLIIREDVSHQLDTNGSIQLIIYLDPATPAGKNIAARYLQGKDFSEPDVCFSPGEESLFQKCLVNQEPGTTELLIELVMDKIMTVSEEVCTDARILAVVRRIRQISLEELSIGMLADEACLSPSRLRALFKNKIGMSIHTYIIRQRLLNATNSIINGRPVQDAAYAAGFTDASHFNRTMVKVFGCNPTDFIRDNQDFSVSGDRSFTLQTYSPVPV